MTNTPYHSPLPISEHGCYQYKPRQPKENKCTLFRDISSFFRNNQNIEAVRLKRCSLDINSWLLFTRCTLQSPSIQEICIEDTPLPFTKFTAALMAFDGNLDKVTIKGSQIGDKHIKLLANCWMVDNTAPTTLDLSRNTLSERACDQLSRVMKVVESLSLSHCQSIGTLGVYSLLLGNESLTKTSPSSLSSLNLSATGIGDIACGPLYKMLKSSCYTTKELILNDNNISNRGLAILLTGLGSNKHLQRLSLKKNNITNKGWSHVLPLVCNDSSINETFESNHTIQMVEGPSKTFWKNNLGKKIQLLLGVNCKAAEEAQHHQIGTGEKGAAAEKIIRYHLQDLYNRDIKHLVKRGGSQSKPVFLDCSDDHIFPYVLGWLGKQVNERYTAMVLTSFTHIVKHKCNVFELKRSNPLYKKKRNTSKIYTTGRFQPKRPKKKRRKM